MCVFYVCSIFSLSAKDFNLETEISFTVNEEHFKVKNIKLKLSLRELDVSITRHFIKLGSRCFVRDSIETIYQQFIR